MILALTRPIDYRFVFIPVVCPNDRRRFKQEEGNRKRNILFRWPLFNSIENVESDSQLQALTVCDPKKSPGSL